MHFLGRTLALFGFQLSLVLAQQPCYWPDGSSIMSSQGTWINCYSSQDSVCCYQGHACLSNGLCYGAGEPRTYRGACTVEDWSNTTACPTQWCNDATNDEPPRWWCGADEDAIPCQSGKNAHFPVYTNGSILGTPPITASPAKTSAGPSLSAQIQGQSTDLPIDPPAPARTQKHSASLPIAIGVGIGIPLGIVGIGLLVLLFWKEAARQRRSKSQILSQGTVLKKEGRRAAAAIGGGRSELPDAQLPRELEDTGKRELPSI